MVDLTVGGVSVFDSLSRTLLEYVSRYLDIDCWASRYMDIDC
jgi:hypothetical protein